MGQQIVQLAPVKAANRLNHSTGDQMPPENSALTWRGGIDLAVQRRPSRS